MTDSESTNEDSPQNILYVKKKDMVYDDESKAKTKKPLSEAKRQQLQNAHEKLRIKREVDKIRREEDNKKKRDIEADDVLKSKFSLMFESEFNKLKESLTAQIPKKEIVEEERQPLTKKKVVKKPTKKPLDQPPVRQEVIPQVQQAPQLSKVDIMLGLLKQK